MKPQILIADDDPVSQSILMDLVVRQGYKVIVTDNGQSAWNLLHAEPRVQLAFIDWMMPGMDGLELCAKIKAEIRDRYVYSIMITAKSEKEDLIKGLEAGADEFISKPVHEGELISRLRAGERVLNYEQRLRHEMRRSDELLANILPPRIASRLKSGEQFIADFFPSASVLFLDIVGFTQWCLRMDAITMIKQLNALFELFDEEIAKHGLEKIKSVGDAYLVAAGLPNPQPNHAAAIAKLALAIQSRVSQLNEQRLHPWCIRTGITSGPVVAGVVGQNRFIYDVWGDTVNNASRLENAAAQNEILISESTMQLLDGGFHCEPLGSIQLKGIGQQNVWKLVGTKN